MALAVTLSSPVTELLKVEYLVDSKQAATTNASPIYPLASKAYPNWQQGDHANGGDRITHNKRVWQVHWRTRSEPKATDGSWKPVCGY